MQCLSREQPYDMPTSIMVNLHNNVSAPADHVNPFTPFNTHSPSSSSVFGRSFIPALTTKSMMLFRQKMDERNHEMVNLVENIMDQGLNVGYIGQTLYLLCQKMFYKLNFLRVVKFLSSQHLPVKPVNPLSNI